MLPQGPCWTKPISYPAWAGGSALRAGQGTMGKWMWTNQFPNYFPLLPPIRRGKGRGQRGKGILGPELQLPLRGRVAPGLPPFTFNLFPRHLLGVACRLRSSFPSGFSLEREDWRFKNRGTQAHKFILNPAKICLAFFFFFKNHNSWVKNQCVTRHQPQPEPSWGEIGVPNGVPQPQLCCSLNPLGSLTQISPISPGY